MPESPVTSARPVLSPALGGGMAGLGLLCFIGALAYGLRTPPENPEVAAAQKALAETTDKLAAVRAETPQLGAQALSVRDQQTKLKDENDTLERTVKERTAKLEMLQNERNAALAAAQKQQNEVTDAALKEQRELQLKNATQLNQTELQTVLTRYQKMLVTILSDQGQLGTGFYYSLGNSAVIVSPLAKASVNMQLIMKVNIVTDSSGKTATVAAAGRVLYVDAETGLSFISANFPPSVQVHTFVETELGQAASGDKVYALSMQVVGDTVLDNNVLDGDVSSTDRREGNFTYMQIAMAANEGMCGGPVIGRDGRLVGILTAAAPGLERTSFALRAGDLPRAAARFRQAPVPQAPAQQRLPDAQPRNQIANRNGAPAIDAAKADAAAREHPLPYKKEEALGIDLDQRHSVIEGPDGLLVIVDTVRSHIQAYRPRIQAPAWDHACTGRVELAVIKNVQQLLEIPQFSNDRRSTLKVVDLRTGAAAPRGGKFPATLGQCIELAGGMYFSHADGYGSAFVDSSTGNSFTATTERVIGATTDRVYVIRGSNTLGSFEMSAMLGMQQQLQSLEQQLRALSGDRIAVQRIAGQLQELEKRIRDCPKVYPAEMGAEATGQIFQAGLDRFLIGNELWEIKPTGVRKAGTLPSLEHSAMREAWFEGFYPAYSRFGNNPIHPIAVSPNGKWAVSQTHLYDLAGLKAAAELPLPAQRAGILSDNKTLWLYDNRNQMIYFLDIATLTGGKAP